MLLLLLACVTTPPRGTACEPITDAAALGAAWRPLDRFDHTSTGLTCIIDAAAGDHTVYVARYTSVMTPAADDYDGYRAELLALDPSPTPVAAGRRGLRFRTPTGVSVLVETKDDAVLRADMTDPGLADWLIGRFAAVAPP